MPTPMLHSVNTAHLPPVGVGMSKGGGFGFEMGVYDRNASMAQIPQIVPPQVPSTVTSGQSGLSAYPGPASSQMIGVPVPRVPPFGTLAWSSGTTSASAHTDTAT